MKKQHMSSDGSFRRPKIETRRTLDKNRKITDFGDVAKRLLSQNHCLYRCLRWGKRYLYYVLWRTRVYCRKRNNLLDFDKIYWLDPSLIEFCTEIEFNPFYYDGVVLDGDWDLTDKKFENLDVFISFQEHFLRDLPWEDTIFYKNIVNEIANQRYHWGCKTVSDFLVRCKKIDELFCNIKKNGYKKQTALTNEFLGVNKIDEISVNLDRNGRPLFNNSAHRLAIAKILQLDRIPIRVTVVHKQCSNFEMLLGKY